MINAAHSTRRRLFAAGLLLSVLAGFASSAAASEMVKRGEILFKACAKCHDIGAAAKNKRKGPQLNDIFANRAGSREGYNYSRAMRFARKTGLRWNLANLDAFLENPKRFIPKNRMKYAGMKAPEDRAALIAFLKSHTKGANPDQKWQKSLDTEADPKL